MPDLVQLGGSILGNGRDTNGGPDVVSQDTESSKAARRTTVFA